MNRYYVKTKYDKNNNPIITSLYDKKLILHKKDIEEENHLLFSMPGWLTLKEMMILK